MQNRMKNFYSLEKNGYIVSAIYSNEVQEEARLQLGRELSEDEMDAVFLLFRNELAYLNTIAISTVISSLGKGV